MRIAQRAARSTRRMDSISDVQEPKPWDGNESVPVHPIWKPCSEKHSAHGFHLRCSGTEAVGRERIGPIHPHLNAEHIQSEVAYTMSMKAVVAVLLLPVAFLTLSGQQRTSDTGQNASPTN